MVDATVLGGVAWVRNLASEPSAGATGASRPRACLAVSFKYPALAILLP